MNKIVKEHYPISKLPEDLRTGLNPEADVTVTIEQETVVSNVMTLEEILASRRPPYRTAAEINRAIRKSRNEWND